MAGADGVSFPTIHNLARPGHAAFAELGQMLPVNAIDLGLHLGMPALDQDRELTDQPSRAKPVEKDFLCWALGRRRLVQPGLL